jgi:hypothetical protein
MTTPEERDALVEAVTTAYRPRDPFTLMPRAHDAWHDLDEAGRLEAYERALEQRDLESAMDPNGLSTTAQQVLARIRAT